MSYNFEERYNEIRKKLIAQGYANKRITYKEFLSLYESYKEEMSEKEFANVLGISYGNWQNIKHRNEKAVILKKDMTDEDREKLKQEIVSELIERGYQNKRIDYTEFLKLYEPYRIKLKESEFASILGISYSNLQHIKHRNEKAVILKKDMTNEDREKLKQEIVSELIERGYQNKGIDYTEFLKLYEPYRIKLKESEFASILGILNSNLRNMKYNRNQKTIIIKKDKTDEEKKRLEQEIVSELIERGYQNKSIDYAEFLKLYEPYRTKVKESSFANILGISYKNWQNIKNSRSKCIINFEHKYSSRILYLFGENKEYDLKYFEEVSKNLGLPIYKILKIITKERTNLEELINALHTRGKIFVGQTRISDSFLQKYGEVILDDIHEYSKQIGKKLHTGMYAEDFAQEAILWVIDKKGNMERNFEEDLALERIIKYAKTYCKYMHFEAFCQKKVVSLDEVVAKDGRLTRLTRVKSKENVQNSVEKREEEIEISEEDTPITVIHQCLLNGMNREESLSFVMEKFNITQKELLEMLTEELSKKNKLKVSETGEIYLGARYE